MSGDPRLSGQPSLYRCRKSVRSWKLIFRVMTPIRWWALSFQVTGVSMRRVILEGPYNGDTDGNVTIRPPASVTACYAARHRSRANCSTRSTSGITYAWKRLSFPDA
jgi:hypothetical protein